MLIIDAPARVHTTPLHSSQTTTKLRVHHIHTHIMNIEHTTEPTYARTHREHMIWQSERVDWSSRIVRLAVVVAVRHASHSTHSFRHKCAAFAPAVMGSLAVYTIVHILYILAYLYHRCTCVVYSKSTPKTCDMFGDNTRHTHSYVYVAYYFGCLDHFPCALPPPPPPPHRPFDIYTVIFVGV